jgi:lysophospholipase L1-like esterase
MEKLHTYLALGDSYTVGEGIPNHKNFPNQLVQLLRKKGIHMAAPEIVARTGWTTDELAGGMSEHQFLGYYDLVTLLIGVNNQYRGRAVLEFKIELETLLNRALHLADNKKERTILISIPDYSVTPFAAKLDTDRTSKEIETFNSVIKALSIQYKVQYLDITPGSRRSADDPTLLAADSLHPSEKEYTVWAQSIAEHIKGLFK